MSQKHKTGLLYAAGITLALLGLVSQSAIAQETPAQPADAMTVVRDAETGKLRAPTAEEQAALQVQATNSKARARVARQMPEKRFHAATGARGMRMTDDFTSSAIAVRKPDGSIEMQCFDSHGADKSAQATGHVHTNKVDTE